MRFVRRAHAGTNLLGFQLFFFYYIVNEKPMKMYARNIILKVFPFMEKKTDKQFG